MPDPDPGQRLGEVGVAYVVLRPGETTAETEIIGFCRDRLANFKVPRAVCFAGSLPRNASGKVLKYELRNRRGTPT
jgi:acyl-CoA synthetase (AMP-forming)/AMP-acid ligase II